MGHDQLFKDLLKAFFFDFLTLFVPTIAAEIDPEAITFIDPQTFTDVPEGQQRTADLAAEVRTRAGDPEIVLIHTEIESDPKEEFGYRLWEYHALLRVRHHVPVISVALLPFTGKGGVQLVRYTETLLGQTYTHLEYWEIRLKDLSASDYLAVTSILGPTLAALMQPDVGGRPALKLAIVERLIASGLDEARAALAVNFMETYLALNEREQVEYASRIRREGAKHVQQSELTWADKLLLKGEEKGLEVGREEGALHAKRMIVAHQARAKFGMLPNDVSQQLAVASSATLDELLDRVVRVHTLEAFLEGLAG